MHFLESSGQPSCCSCGGDAQQPEKTKTQDQQPCSDTGIQTLLVWFGPQPCCNSFTGSGREAEVPLPFGGIN